MPTDTFETEAPQLNSMPQSQNMVKGILLPAAIIIAVILAGAGSGWLLSSGKIGGGDMTKAPGATVSGGGKEVGIDKANFNNQAEGTLQKGGIDGEGTHHLVRPGGESQNVYLTSSVVDLDQFIDKKVQVSGETFSGIKAGWLMDIGKVKILE